DFAPQDSNGHTDIYVRDLAAGTTILVSVGPGGVPGDDNSRAPSIDGSGVRVAFESKATNLVGGAPPGYSHVYLRDLAAGTTTLIDRAPGPGGAPAGGNSTDPEINADGNRIVFQSYGKLTADSTGSPAWAFVRDIRAADTQLASRADGPAGSATTL